MKVTTQAELDAALADKSVYEIAIDSPAGVWLTIGDTKDKYVTVEGYSCIESITGTVERVDGNGTVEWVYGNGTVERVYGNGTVERVDGNGTVLRAAQAATVHLYEEGHLTKASATVAVFLHHATATVDGGNVIDLTQVDTASAAGWCGWNDVEIVDGRAILYKAVDDEFKSGYRFAYPIGETVEAPDWRDTDECGFGLHFSPSPIQARDYNMSATKFLRVAVPLEFLRPITEEATPKAKAKLAEVLCEVDLWAEPVTVAEVSA